MVIVLRQRYFWPLAIWFFFTSKTMFGFGGLWGGPYMMEVHNLTKAETANILTMIPVGMIIGSPLFSIFSDRVVRGRKPVLIASASTLIVIIAFTTTKELFPKDIAGTSTGTVNFFAFFGGAVFQPLMGMVLDKIGRIGGVYPPSAYRWAFFGCFVAIIIAFGATLFMKETLHQTHMDSEDSLSPT